MYFKEIRKKNAAEWIGQLEAEFGRHRIKNDTKRIEADFFWMGLLKIDMNQI